MNTEERKLNALNEAVERGLLNMSTRQALPFRQEIERKHKVKMLVEGKHCISVWTARTSIIKRYA